MTAAPNQRHCAGHRRGSATDEGSAPISAGQNFDSQPVAAYR